MFIEVELIILAGSLLLLKRHLLHLLKGMALRSPLGLELNIDSLQECFDARTAWRIQPYTKEKQHHNLPYTIV